MSARAIHTVLILGEQAETYRNLLAQDFADLPILTARHAEDMGPDASITVVVGNSSDMSRSALAGLPNLRWVQALSSGTDGFAEVLPPNVVLTSMRGIHGPMLREYALMGMLALTGQLEVLITQKQQRRWVRRPRRLLFGKTAVVVGTGASGSAVAQILSALEMHVIGVSQTPRPISGFAEVVGRKSLAEAVARADFIINVLPGTPDNENLFDARIFNAAQRGSMFLNLGRGSSVDEDALVNALDEERLAGAALDVFRTEPLPADSPLWGHPNVLITPHIAGYCAEYEQMAAPIIRANMASFLSGQISRLTNMV